MPLHQLQNQKPASGDELRDLAADYLSTRFKNVQIESLVSGKKVDIQFEHMQFGQTTTYFAECKDYDSRLGRKDVALIWADYGGIVEKNAPAKLLIVTRNGLSPAASKYINDERPEVQHQTIWEVENHALDLLEYQMQLRDQFTRDDLSQYYINATAKIATYQSSDGARILSDEKIDLFNRINEWVLSDSHKPIAVLGGYGAGKTSFAKKVASYYAGLALEEPSGRRVVSIKLGGLTSAASLPNLLGGMFTNLHPIQNFNYERFIKFNANGRLLIILDGFDEMKHAMPWNDFKFIVKELNRLVVDKSKVILLGRPTALLTEYEHWHVLRGIKKLDEMTTRLPGWPEYDEYDLSEFDKTERHSFIKNYMTVALKTITIGGAKEDLSADMLSRVSEVCKIADREAIVFSKPVHLRILVEIATNLNANLTDLSVSFSRWKLYRLFVDSLIEREMEKEARKDIPKGERLQFLRELVAWLWDKKNASTSFSVAELPFKMPEDEVREYLIGSVLEKKSTDYYYFAHRSFPEYFLADLILENPSEPRSHERNSAILTDGVELFLMDGADNSFYETAIGSLSSAKGKIGINYLNFLLSYRYSKGAKAALLSKKSTWLPLVELIETKHEGETGYLDSIGNIIDLKSSPEQWAMSFLGMLHLNPRHSIKTKNFTEKLMTRMLAYLLQRIFVASSGGAVERSFTVEEADVGFHVHALKRSTEFGETRHDGKAFIVDSAKLDKYLRETLENEGIVVDFGVDDYFSSETNGQYQVSLEQVANQCGGMQSAVLTHFQRNRNLQGITLKKTKKRITLKR